jgi:hypothetical protein
MQSRQAFWVSICLAKHLAAGEESSPLAVVVHPVHLKTWLWILVVRASHARQSNERAGDRVKGGGLGKLEIPYDCYGIYCVHIALNQLTALLGDYYNPGANPLSQQL